MTSRTRAPLGKILFEKGYVRFHLTLRSYLVFRSPVRERGPAAVASLAFRCTLAGRLLRHVAACPRLRLPAQSHHGTRRGRPVGRRHSGARQRARGKYFRHRRGGAVVPLDGGGDGDGRHAETGLPGEARGLGYTQWRAISTCLVALVLVETSSEEEIGVPSWHAGGGGKRPSGGVRLLRKRLGCSD